MKVFLLVLIGVLCANSHELRPYKDQSTTTEHSAPSPSHKVSITFIGTVKSIEELGERELQVIPVDFDSRFAVTVHIESITPSEVPLKVDTDQIFAVHSPARLFRAMKENIIGRKYRFKVAWNGRNTNSRFYELTAVPIGNDDSQKK